MYNEVFINTLSERLNEVQEFLKDPKSDFYSTVASILYGKKYFSQNLNYIISTKKI